MIHGKIARASAWTRTHRRTAAVPTEAGIQGEPSRSFGFSRGSKVKRDEASASNADPRRTAKGFGLSWRAERDGSVGPASRLSSRTMGGMPGRSCHCRTSPRRMPSPHRRGFPRLDAVRAGGDVSPHVRFGRRTGGRRRKSDAAIHLPPRESRGIQLFGSARPRRRRQPGSRFRGMTSEALRSARGRPRAPAPPP